MGKKASSKTPSPALFTSDFTVMPEITEPIHPSTVFSVPPTATIPERYSYFTTGGGFNATSIITLSPETPTETMAILGPSSAMDSQEYAHIAPLDSRLQKPLHGKTGDRLFDFGPILKSDAEGSKLKAIWCLGLVKGQEFSAWYARVRYHCAAQWKSNKLADFISLSMKKIERNAELVAALLPFWSTSSNAFLFRFGSATPTLLDMNILFGVGISGRIEPSTTGDLADQHGLDTSALAQGSYSSFMTRFATLPPVFDEKDADDDYGEPVSRDEHIAFMIYWLSKFVFLSPSKKPLSSFLPLAVALVERKGFPLGQILLGSLYRAINRYIEDGSHAHNGPLWILQMWAFLYFPQLRGSFTFPTARRPAGFELLSFEQKKSATYFEFFYNTAAYETPLAACTFLENYPGSVSQGMFKSMLTPRDLLVITEGKNGRRGGR